MGKRGSYTIKFKKAAAEFGKQTSVSESSRKFEVDRKRVREWISQLDNGKFYDVPVTTMRLSGAAGRCKTNTSTWTYLNGFRTGGRVE